MKAIFFIFCIFFMGNSLLYSEAKASESESTLDDYKIFTLAKCIASNYEKMGVDFTKLPLKDNTMGFIDIDAGLAFYRNKDNALASFINKKTGDFYRPKQTSGDLASSNMVIYDCVNFYHSKELDVFLKKIIHERTVEIERNALE
ncbi:TPA: hypothetical protein ACWQBO_005068 [Escherichia coli]